MKTILYTIKNFAKRVVMALVAVLMVSNAWGVTYTKVTDVGSLAAGDEILIVSEHANKAISTTQNTNNRAAQAVTISSSTITDPSGVQVITLEASSTNWKFKVGTDAYLYAASSSKNYLRTETSTNAGSDGIWSISITDGNATIQAQGDNTNDLLQYNNNNTLFSCYGSTQSNGAVQIYKKGSSTFTVDFAVSPAGYGTVSPSAQLTGITSGTTITTSSNTVTINGTTVTATPHAQDADYNYAFSSWSVTDNLTTVTKNITVTANFSRTPRGYKNYRTACCSEWTPPSLSGYSTSLTAGGATTTISVGSGTTYGAKTCESSNPDVLTVTDAGVITPVGAGTATVTVHWAGDATHCEEEVTTNTITVTGNVTITFKKNGGGGTDNQTQSIPVSTSTALKTLAQLGYTAPSCKRFKGWATSEANANAGTVAYDTDGMNITVTEATTLWASWEYIPYTVARGSGTATGCDGGTFTFSPSTVDCGGTVTITSSPDATHKGDPTITILPAGNGTVVGNTITNVIGNITSISVSYAAKESYMVTLNPGNGSLSATGSWATSGDNLTQTVLEGNNVTAMPAATPGCSGWAFVGWKQGSAANDQVSFTPDKSAGDVFSPAANVTYYAVYRQNAAGGTTYNKITNIGDLTTGNYVIKTSSYAMNNSGDIIWNAGSGYYRMNETSTSGSGESITNSNADLVWTIIKLGSNYAIKSGSKYVGIDKDGILVYDTDIHFFTASYNGSSNRWEFTSTEDPSSQLVYSTYFRSMDTQNTAILLYKQGASGTGNYFSSPTCSDYTVTGVANPAAGGSVTLSATSAKEGEKVYAMCTPDPAYNFTNWTISGTGVSPTTSTNQIVEITVGAGNVTATANFAEKVVYTVSWNVNNANYTIYTGAGTLSTSAESGTLWSALTLPDDPADNTLSDCERTKFVGWSTSPLTGDGQSAPADLFKTTSDANATSHSITGNTTFYAVFAKGGDDSNWVLNGSNISALSSSTGYAKYNGAHTGDNALNGIEYTTSGVLASSSNLQFQANGGNVYNTTAMPDNITSIVLTSNALSVFQGTSAISSTSALTAITPTGSGPYTYTFASGKKYFCVKKEGSGAATTTVTVNYAGTATDYVTSCACSWNIDYITNGKKNGDGSAIWSEDNCFQQVSTTHEWQIENFAMPNVAGQFWVGPGYFKGSGDWGHSVIADLSTVKYVRRSDKVRTDYSAVSNMIGTLNVWDNGGDDNYHVGIYPDYQITYGVQDGGDPWTKVDFNYISSTTYETEVVTAPTYFAVTNFKYYVGVKTDGNTGYGGKSSTVLMNTMPGMTSSQDGKHGKWRMYEDSGDPNWYCAWVPYYVLSYDANGGTGAPSAETAVSSEGDESSRTKTVSSTVPTREGYTFIGWNTNPGGDGTAKSAGDNIILTGDMVLYAQWAQNFAVTYDLDGGSASPECLGGTYYVGQTVDVCTSTPTKISSSFLGWKRLDTGATVAGGSSFSMPSNNVTIQAQWETVYYHIYYKEEDGTAIATDDVPQTAETTLRNQSPCPGYSFYGWSTSKITTETTTKPTGVTFIGKGGASYTPTADITVYPVYARSEGATTVKDTLTVANTGVTTSYTPLTGIDKNSTPKTIHSDAVYAIGAYNSSGMQFTDGTSNEDQKKSSLITTTSGGSLQSIRARIPYACSTTRYLYTKGNTSDYTMQQRSSQGGTLAWTVTHSTKADTWYSHDFSEDGYTSFFMYCGGGATKVDSIIVTWGTGTYYYATHCEIKEYVTITYNGNGGTVGCGSPASGTVTTVTWDYADGGMGAPTLAESQTICNSATRAGYILNKWNTAADGTGRDYAKGATVTRFGGDSTLYAIWDRIYTVTLYDNGVERTTLVEASAGAGVTLPSGNNCTPGSAFTFVGWTESAVELNADPVRPATLHAAGAFAPTSDITLYSVYSKSVAGCEDFAEGVSGAYKMYYDGSKYATTAGTSGSYTGATSGTAEVFYIAYAPAHTGYTIRTSTGFVGWNYDGSELTKANATPYYWKISGSSSNWVITPEPSAYTKQLKSTDGSKFQLYAAATSGKLLLQKSAMTYYYNTAICGENSITFHDGGGTISGTPTTPTGASWNSGTHVLSGLEDCDKITTFPTANYDGWTFIGWSTEDYSNSGKHTTDHPEENAGTDEPDGSEIYKTGGNSYVVRGGSVDLYPVFTRFPENEPFNTETGGDYYIYYLKPGTDDGYGANIRVYAGEYDGEKRYSQTTSCAAATTFTFTKSGDVWHIQNKANSKYIGGKLNEDWLVENASLGTLTDWTITIKSGNQFYASCQGGGRYITFSTSANYFMDYSTTANPGICLPVYLGSCTERIYSSEPKPVPTIDLTGEPYVTSSAGERVRATATMTLSGYHLTSVPANKVKVSGTNLKFAKTATENPADYIMVEVDGSGNASATIYVYYTPVATEDGIDNIIVTAQAFNGSSSKDLKTTSTVHARHLPADFVIAAKWGDKWYALPNTCAGEGSNTAGVQIEVDNNDVPTAATAAPSTAKWGMRQAKAGSRSDGSYNDRLVFTERTTAEANNQKTLYNYNKAEVFTSATYTNYNNTNPERYEWIPVTTDFGDYELTNANNADHHLILRNSDGLFVAQNSDKSYDGKVRLLPATFYEEAPVQIVEWKANSVVVMYTGTETSATTKVGTNSATSAQTLSTHKLTHGIYELTTNQSLSVTSNAGKTLLLSFGATKKAFEIPIIITDNTTASTGHDKQDVIITKTGKLTAAATKYSYRNIYVYGGGKLKISSETSLGVNNIIMRAGGITTSGIGTSPSATYEYIYPQVELGGTFTSTKTNIHYEYITDYYHWYQLCLPFNGTLTSITYPQEYYGNNVAADNKGSWIIKRYAGEIRATGEYDAWKDIETEGATSVTAGHGYLYWGAPKKLTIGGETGRSAWGIQRMTMPVTAAAATSAETDDKNITVDSYSEVATSTKPNDQGWNLVGNPYMVNLTDLSSTSIIAGKLVQEKDDKENWTGKWKNDGSGVRYVTVPDNHFDTYVAKTATEAAADGDFMPGRAFFVQIAEGATTLTFAAENRASLMPALFARATETIDIETGIVMSDETKKDEVNFWIKDGKTAEYEFNADYPKTPNSTNFNIYGVHDHGDLSWIAISPEIAEGSMAIGYQVPAAGDYMLSLSETYVSDDIEHIFVTDHEASPEVTVDLVERDYIFHVNQAETNNTRFTVSIKLKDEDTGTTTGIDNLDVDSDVPTKFIYQDKMYILYHGIIYDATGKRVSIIKR